MVKKRFIVGSALGAAVVASLGTAAAQERETTTVVTQVTGGEWDIDAPVFLRAATPEEEGVWTLKNIFGWHRQRGDAEKWEYDFVAEYGFMREHSFIFEVPVELAEGRVDGNGDLNFGWHWRLWEEAECEKCGATCPEFALRNTVRIPGGVDSSGVDYTLRGLFSWSVTPGESRFHLNPFLRLVAGDNNDDDPDITAREFRRGSFLSHRNDEENVQFGAAVGMDYKINDEMLFVWDYLWSSRQFDQEQENHLLELALEWEFAEDQLLAFATEVGLDGNHSGRQFGARIMYQLALR